MNEHSFAPDLDLSAPPIKVLLVDDQALIGASVKQMLAAETDIQFQFCDDPLRALEVARQFRPTVILQDLVMPQVDGLLLVKFYRADPATKEVPLIVLSSKEEPVTKAEAFGLGANDYLVKLPDRIELVARIRYHSAGYTRLLQRNEAYRQLAESRRQMADELDAASQYLRSLLPPPVANPVALDWRYVPCAQLGGDTFGYEWLDDDHLSLYMLDVTGHGLASALLSVSIMNVLRSRSLPNTDFHKPDEVLAALNTAFTGDTHGDKFFTIWYGVYNRKEHRLSWAGGGHPDAVLFSNGHAPPQRLGSDGPMMGMMPWPDWTAATCAVPHGSRLFLFTDGVFEIHRPGYADWTFQNFLDWMAATVRSGSSTNVMDRMYEHVQQLHASPLLDDDFSVLEAVF